MRASTAASSAASSAEPPSLSSSCARACVRAHVQQQMQQRCCRRHAALPTWMNSSASSSSCCGCSMHARRAAAVAQRRFTSKCARLLDCCNRASGFNSFGSEPCVRNGRCFELQAFTFDGTVTLTGSSTLAARDGLSLPHTLQPSAHYESQHVLLRSILIALLLLQLLQRVLQRRRPLITSVLLQFQQQPSQYLCVRQLCATGQAAPPQALPVRCSGSSAERVLRVPQQCRLQQLRQAPGNGVAVPLTARCQQARQAGGLRSSSTSRSARSVAAGCLRA